MCLLRKFCTIFVILDFTSELDSDVAVLTRWSSDPQTSADVAESMLHVVLSCQSEHASTPPFDARSIAPHNHLLLDRFFVTPTY